jgi:hypothetical protein
MAGFEEEEVPGSRHEPLMERRLHINNNPGLRPQVESPTICYGSVEQSAIFSTAG